LYILFCISLSYSQGTWTQKANVFTTSRGGAVGFSIGNKGYIGTGWQWNTSLLYNDFWEWDQASNAWTQKASFAGNARGDAVAFSIGNKGYVVTGDEGFGTFSNGSLWEWDQAINIWSPKAMFPGLARAYAAAFSIGLNGYVGCGYASSNYLSDFWEYSQLNDSWTQKADIPIGRTVSVSFSIGSKGYVCSGKDVTQTLLFDLWEFNPASNVWTQKANFPGVGRGWASGFSIGNKGYVGTGWNGTNSYSDFWCYDPATDAWLQKADYPHLATDIDHSGFSIGCKGYFGTGATDPNPTAFYYNDFWEFEPDTCSLTGIEIPNFGNLQFLISPNPFSEILNITINGFEPLEIIIYDMNSKKVFCKNFTHAVSIDTKSFSKGIYLYEVTNKKGYLKRGKVFKD
jgi:N-acetylneuraminic acid mutarotase